jgi:putative methionine-R-sulfoxide reductase with GAF domain
LAWKRKSEGRKKDLAEGLGLSLCLVIDNLFLKGEPVNRVNFIEICQFLGLNWREIAGVEEQEKPISSPRVGGNPSKANASSASRPPIVVSNTSGDVNEVDQAINELVSTLCEMLHRLTRKAGDLVRADRTSIFLLDQHRRVLGTVVADDGEGGGLVIDIPLGKGIAGLAATSSQVINVPFDVYDDPRSEAAKNTDQKTGYRTYSLLAWPVLNKQKDLVAVVQLINKLKANHDPEDDLSRRIDRTGFTQEDEARFAKFAPSILKLLEKSQFCYQLSLKVRNNAGVNQAGAFQNAELIAQLKRQERLLRNSLNRFKLEDKSSRKQKARR